MPSKAKDEWKSNAQPMDINGCAIYHEKQAKELCALHALNNLFQDGSAFSRKQLDDICFTLSPNHLVNPHKSFLGLGNYDVNVVMAAVQTKDCEAIWFDKRRSVDKIVVDKVYGFILNVPIDYKLGFLKFPTYRKHWVCVREIAGQYYNLDSKLDGAILIGAAHDLRAFLKDHLASNDKELLLVVDRQVAECRTWLDDNSEDDAANDNGIAQNSTRNNVIVERSDDRFNANVK